jgi:predicted transcriptional regulator
MKANHYSGVAVRLPTDLRDILENMAVERGESLSLIIRDALRAAVDARRGDHGIPQIRAGSADSISKDLK